MALTSASTKNLMKEYHRLAADTLLGQRHSHLSQALLSAAEDGQYDRIQSLLSDPNASLDARCPLTGDTPLIAAARNDHQRVVQLLVEMGADLTLSNDMEESALEVASVKLRKIMLSSIDHNGRTMSNAQALLQNAWLGDAVSVKKHLSSGNHYLDVNCSNNDGMTPLLLVTRDINLFDSIQAAMETDYNPVNVVQDLIDNHADISHCDPKGRSVLHFVATSECVHARKMVSLLMRSGSKVDSLDHELNSPLHIASGKGHTAIIIALVEEGGADVNSKGGERNDTPLMLTARAGHSEAARYLLAKGADVMAVDDNGDSALTVATSHSMVSLLKEAWTEQSTTSKSEGDMLSGDYAESAPSSPSPTPEPPQLLSNRSFFLTDQSLSQSFSEPLAVPTHLLSGPEEESPGDGLTPRPLRVSGTSTEADDELDANDDITTSPPIKQSPQNHIKQPSVDVPKTSEPLETEIKSRSLPHNLFTGLSQAAEDEELKGQETATRRGNKGRIKNEKKSKQNGKKGDRKRPLKLPFSLDQLAEANDRPMTKGQDRSSQFLPNVLSKQTSSPHVSRPSHMSHPLPSDNKLPLLNNMQAVAMVAVDTEQERFRVQNFGEGSPNKTRKRASQPKAIGRSKSMQPVKLSELSLGVGVGGGHRRGSHEGSFHPFRKSDPTPPTKTTFLPNVVTPQLHGPFTGSCEGSRATPQYGQHRQKGRGRLQPMTNKKSSPIQPPSIPLSMVTERSAESAERTDSTTELQDSQDDSNNSTLKASISGSEFDVDSLEKSRNITAAPVAPNPPQPTILSPLEAQVFNLFPPTPGTAHHQSNLVINYARQEGNVPLSPIWNRMPSTSADTSSSEFITSYIGQSTTPSPRESGECGGVRHVVGADSGQGESSGEEGRSEGSDDTDSSEEEHESLRWKRGRLLGKGAYGKVWEGLLDSGTLIAVKEVELDFVNLEKAQSQYEKIQLEVEILRSLRHKHVVKYLGTSLQEGLVFIFMDYISGGSLQSVLKRFGPLHYRNISLYTKQITRALVYLHSNGIIHRDIKGANVMVTSRGVVKLIDFGCAKRYCTEGGATGLHSVRGTPYWMSPEVICGHGYGRKSDIWSLGCTVHEMAVSKPPWADFPPESALFQIGLGKSLPQLPDHLSPVLVDFIHRCLTKEQTERPSALQLLEDTFLASTRRRSSTNSNR